MGDGEALELLAAHDFGLTTSDQFYVLELTAVPASGAGAALTARVEMAQGLGRKLPMLLEGRMTGQAPSQLLSGTLTLHDASSGETLSHDTFSLQSDGLLTLRDELYGSTFETSIVPVRLNADLAALLGDAYAPLLSRLEELQEGETLTLSLRECALPLAQALYRPAADGLMEALGIDRDSIARDLPYLSGTIALTPTRNGLRITLLTDSDPRSYHYKFELDDRTKTVSMATSTRARTAATSPSAASRWTQRTVSTSFWKTIRATAISLSTPMKDTARPTSGLWLSTASAPPSLTTSRATATAPTCFWITA